MTTIKVELEIVARAEIARRTEALFRSSGALRDGHFLLKSGRHSEAYLEKFAVLSDPAAQRRSISSPGRRPGASSWRSRPAASSARGRSSRKRFADRAA